MSNFYHVVSVLRIRRLQDFAKSDPDPTLTSSKQININYKQFNFFILSGPAGLF